jgi:hypothetical protein
MKPVFGRTGQFILDEDADCSLCAERSTHVYPVSVFDGRVTALICFGCLSHYGRPVSKGGDKYLKAEIERRVREYIDSEPAFQQIADTKETAHA